MIRIRRVIHARAISREIGPPGKLHLRKQRTRWEWTI